jgi:GAF domain-containing protein
VNPPLVRQISLGIKLPTIVISLLALAFLVATFLSVRTSQSALIDQLQETLLAQSTSQSELIQSHLIWTRSMAVDLAAMAGTVDQSENDQLSTIESTLANNEQVFGSTIAYEPYRFEPDLYYWSPYYSRTPDSKLQFTQLGNPEYNYFKREWYTLPKNQRIPVLSPPYFDEGGGNIWMVTWSVPFFDSVGNLKGVATADIAFSQTQEIVRQIAVGDQGYAFLVDKQGTLLGIGDHGGEYQIMVDSMLAAETQPQAQDIGWNALIDTMVTGGSGFTNTTDPNGQPVFVAYQPIGLDTGWSLGLVFPQTELFQPATQLRNTLIIFSVLVALVFAVILYFFTRTITRPLQELATHTTRFSQEQLEKGQVAHPIQIQTHDELEDLANSFNQMAKNLVAAFENLEGKVADRTHSLELAAEVGRSVSQVRALDIMLKDAAELIRKQFNLYYVQVYLTNPSQTALLLHSGTGTVGAELLNRGHQLPLNANSINGRAAIEKRSVVVADTTASATFKPNPLLPDTRSEMAVPLLIGERVVGVLNMQSGQANALNQDILTAFEALAGQLAIAIQNATFLAETQQARAEVEAQAQRLSRANWVDYLDAIHKPEETGFVFEQNKISSFNQETEIKDNALVKPITVTGEALGNLIVEMEGGSPIARTEELVNAVAQQVARQIESLRLLDSAERYRFEAEEASHRLTRESWKDYMDVNADQGSSYIYDLKEVRPYNQNADQQTEESAFSLPLKVRDETVGKLSALGLKSDDKESLDLVNAVAERLGAHIESLRQFDQTQSALMLSESLFDASRRLSQSTDLQELVKATVETLNIPVVNRASLGVFNYNAAGELETMTDIANWWSGSGTEVAAIGTSYSAGTLKLLSAFLSATPVFFNDAFHDERIGADGMQIIKRLNVRAVAVLPLFLGTHQIGVLRLQAEEPHNFSQDETRLFSALAPQIATVLENRRQFERAQKQADRESALNVISQKIQSATTVEAVLQIAARELGHALGAPMTIAQLSMKDKK